MTQSLSESLRRETRDLHTQAERSAFMGRLLRGQMQRPAYVALLRNLHAIYTALEPALRRHAGHAAVAPLILPGLWRTKSLERDLDALHGAAWAAQVPLQRATMAYVARLHEIEKTDPTLLAAHSYVRYLGDLSGGQMLSRIVRDSLGLREGEGTAFYDFGDAERMTALKKAYRDGLASLALDEPKQQAVVAEAKLAFQAHQALFEELNLDSPPASARAGGPA